MGLFRTLSFVIIAPVRGGGIYGGSAESCTITKNSATNGSGTWQCSVTNSIVYYNAPNQWGGNPSFYQNSCTAPHPPGANNITNPLQFMDGAAGDYRLSSISPCIDTGSNQTWMIHAFDVEGAPRIIDRVDMGAHEYTPSKSMTHRLKPIPINNIRHTRFISPVM